MGIVDHGIAAEVKESIVEVGKSLFKVAEEEVRDTLLEIGNGEVLVQSNCPLVAFHLGNMVSK